jgi:uncharacterized protein YjbI with pentapeptide repeats
VNLEQARLQQARLSEANLVEADLLGADFSDAILDLADLSKAVLKDTKLRKAQFGRAILREVILRDADLSEADFRDADVTGLKFDATKEEVALPKLEYMQQAEHLDQMTCEISSRALTKLHEAFRQAGLSKAAQQVTAAITRCEAKLKTYRQ